MTIFSMEFFNLLKNECNAGAIFHDLVTHRTSPIPRQITKAKLTVQGWPIILIHSKDLKMSL